MRFATGFARTMLGLWNTDFEQKGYVMNMDFKSVKIRISYTKDSRNSEVSVTRKAGVTFGTETTFAQIEGFLEDFKKVIQGYKYCAKNRIFCEVYLSVSTHNGGDGTSQPQQHSFNGWKFEETPDYECEGMYLRPDFRYTSEEHDIWIDFSESLLSQLSEANI